MRYAGMLPCKRPGLTNNAASPHARRGAPAARMRAILFASACLALSFATYAKVFKTPHAVSKSDATLSATYPDSYLPLHPKLCGSGWQAEYARTHAAILRNASAPRFLRARPMAGLGNSLNGMLSLFYVALLTNRALLVHGTPDDALEQWVEPWLLPFINGDYSWGFEPANVNWAWNSSILTSYPTRRSNMGWGERENSWGGHDADGKLLAQTMRGGNLRDFHADAAVLEIVSAVQYTSEIFANPHHKRQLFAWGLRPETAMGCAFHYLFKPTPSMMQNFGDQFATLTDPSTLKIGLHARLGDHGFFEDRLKSNATKPCPAMASCRAANASLSEDEYYGSKFGHFFQCAQDIESHFALPGQPALWYVISDNVGFRAYAKRTYGAKVLTKVDDLPLVNMAFLGEVQQDAKKRLGFEAAAAEFISFSKADYHIMTDWSTFSNTAAAASLQWKSMVRIDLEPWWGPGGWPGCARAGGHILQYPFDAL